MTPASKAAKHRQQAIHYAQLRDFAMTGARDPNELDVASRVEAARTFHRSYLHEKAIANLYSPDSRFTA